MNLVKRCLGCYHSYFAVTFLNRCNRRYCSKQNESQQWPRRVLTGLQPSGALHVGNYFGAVRRCVRLQREEPQPPLIMVADLHALTSVAADGPTLEARVLDLTAALLAAGLDPEACVLWRQSAVPRHAELCWLLACLTTQARLAHLPQYRERCAAGDPAVGSLLYPVLQAADVLLYRATHVPAGADQLQHVQLAALLARTARHRLGVQWPVPRPLPLDDGADRVLSLRDPSKKMSKSDPDRKSRILLVDSDDEIRLKIRKSVTDFTSEVTYDPERRPGVSNLVRLHCLAEDLLVEEAVSQAEGLTTAQYKEVVSAALAAALGPLREKARRMRARPDHLRAVLSHGAARARRLADDTWDHVANCAGLSAKPRDDARRLSLNFKV